MKKKSNYIDNHKRLLQNVLLKHHISDVVRVSTHFIKRFNERLIELEGYKAFNLIYNNICRIIYEFEVGNKPYVQYNKVRIDMKRDDETKQIILTTIYQDTNTKNKKGIFI